MSLGLSISVQDNATPALESKLQLVSPSRLAGILGPGLTQFVQRHLRSNGTNSQGWPSTHFWADAARGTSFTRSDNGDGIVISINKIGVRQRYYGGPIRPVRAKALAIPINPVSYGHVPADFPGLFMIKCASGAYLVQSNESMSEKTGRTIGRTGKGGNAGRRLKSNLTFLFKLSAGVQQDPDPTVIPSEDELTEVSMDLLERAIQ